MAIRYRRNINCLSAEQLYDLREAYQALYDLPDSAADSFATLGGIHGMPAPSWCDHGAPGFLTWHRAYVHAFERALQSVRCDVMLPFWDWSSTDTTGVPAACREPTYVDRAGDTVPNPLFRGPIAAAAGGGTTGRRPDIDTTSFGDLGASARAAQTSTTFSAFQNAINGPHGGVHGRVGGQMTSVPRAGFDPIFFLHHCNVDRQWWNWQRTHPSVALPAAEATHQLDPFTRPFTNQWQVGADVEDTDDLGYRYLNWCIFVPPIIVWEIVQLRISVAALRQLRDAHLIVRSNRMPDESIEFRVFVGDDEATRDDSRDRNPAFAGSIGLFGMGGMAMRDTGRDEHFDIELNLTEHLRRCAPSARDTAGDPSDDRGVGHGHRDEQNGDDAHTVTLALRVAAFDADGAPVASDRVPIDDIELLIE